MIKKIILLLFIITITRCIKAQTYHFFQETGAYQELTNDIDHQTVFDGVNDMLNLSMSFKLYDLDFNFNGNLGLAVGESGFISATSTDGSRVFVIDAFLVRNPLVALNSGSKISYKLEGPIGDQVLKIQWKDVAFQNGPSGEFANFQLWLFQKNGDIEIHYGPSNVSSQAYDGVGGPAIGTFLAGSGFTPVFETLFLVGQTSNPSVDSVNVFAPINGTPPNGTIYKFSTSTVGIEETNSFKSSIHPNPTNNLLFIDSEKLIVEAQIMNLKGQIVWKSEISARNASIDIHSLVKGIYFLKLLSVNHSFSFLKLMKL